MRAQRVGLDEGWPALQGLNGDDPAANTTPTDLTNILDTVAVPIVVVRRDFIIAYFNKAAAEGLGLSPSDIGRPSSDISVLADLPRMEQQCSQVITSGVDSQVDFRDAEKWFVVRISPYTKGDRQVNGAVLTFINVTPFRTSLDHAIYERECIKAILNTVADPLVVLDADQRIQSGNRAFYKMFGLAREETQGVPLNDLGNGAFELPLLHEPEETLPYSHVFRSVEVPDVVTAKGSRTLVLDVHPLSFPGHSERRVLVTFQDITARKQAEAAKDLRSEEELRRSEAFLAEGQRLSLTGSFCWNVTTDEITWSEQLYRTFEFEVGTPVTLERISTRVHPEDVPTMNETLERVRAGCPDFEYSTRLLMPNGSVKYVKAIAHGSRDAEGRLEYIGAVHDVTQRRMSEEALERARSELAKVAGVTSLGVLTASIAHEVNQPLSGIITNASTCLRMLDVDPPNLDGARETARRTIRDGNRASDVITRLRALFSRKEFMLEPLDLNEATREVIALSLSELQRNRVIVHSELADDLPPVSGDRIQLQQVILNLLRNASDAMVGVNDRPRQLTIRTETDEEDRVRLTVQDVGVGLAPQNPEQLFAAFYTTKTNGMGVGLSVSRSIIEGHHGRLWAAPNDGPGATFSFSIPRSLEAATP
ncbi:MAG: PAS domain-containing sensor histidine kinase [Gemmatimonadaceae bacterium]